MRTPADSQAAYDLFLSRVKTSGLVWYLLDTEKDYPAYCGSNNEETSVFPFWSDKPYVKRVISKFPFKTHVDSIPLADFLKYTIPHLIEEGYKVGPNWDSNLAGLEVDPSVLLSEIS